MKKTNSSNTSVPLNEALLEQQPEIYREFIPEIPPITPESEPLTSPEHNPDVQTHDYFGTKRLGAFGIEQSDNIEV